MKRFRNRFLYFFIGVLALMAMLFPSVTSAQEAPAMPELRTAPSPIWGFIVMALLLAAVLVISLMPAKRSHQD